jgi:HupE/UreJ protein
MRRAVLAVVLAPIAAVIALAGARPASAHGMRSVYVEITQTAAGRARVAIRSNLPVTGVALTAAAPCAVATTADAGTELGCPDALTGAALAVTGLGPVASEAVILVSFRDGTTATACLTAGNPSWRIPGAGDPGPLATAGRYVRLGVLHIATGADHLLFLLALVLCLRTLRAVMLAETAFTLSHTLSFSASALGWIHVSSTAAEACIAVSLVLVALDVGRPTRDAPHRAAGGWKTAGLAFAFGGVHGLGFAGGLAEIGLPTTAVPAALAGFAAGVELGQVAFLAAAVSLLALAHRAPRLARTAVQVGAYAVGGTGAFWLLDRLGNR